VKLLIRCAVPSLILLFAGLCFPQAAPKTPAAKPKTAAPAADSAAKAQPKEASNDADDEVIPPAGPHALFPAVVARVNGKPILGRDLEQVVRAQLAPIGNPEWKNLREDYRGQLTLGGLDSLINSKLLYLKAVASGFKVTDAEADAEMQKVAKNFKDDAEMNLALANQQMDRAALEKSLTQNLVISKFVDETIDKKIIVTQDEMAKYYSTHPTDFQHPDIVRTSHILIQPAGDSPEQDALAKQRAEAILARVKKGEDFAKLAKEYSVDGSASQGGDIGFAAKDNLAPEYADAAFSLPVGGVKLVKTDYGYHILKVTDRKKEGLSTLEEVKDRLATFLKDQKSQAELTKLVNKLRDEAKIEILIPAGQPLKAE
jgi:parvulin-like peptidyl-prolyl isomerase